MLTPANPFGLGNAGGNIPIVGTPVDLNDIGIISEKSVYIDPTEDLDGVGTPTWMPIETLPCKLLFRPTGFKEYVRAGEESSLSQWQCYFPLGSNVRTVHRVTVGGFVHEVVATNKGATDAVLLSVFMVRINQ